ncbi:DUF2271 domain-containing protein [Deinococcus gobiensis]|uniref:DUF2271 domain-containing protein n=1 Tax=Deinococcus gobiensis TaxID=502394 RepID=UPI0002ED7FE6|nr:DUF2271 domain-containing protein [Deinococcus gobiensis]
MGRSILPAPQTWSESRSATRNPGSYAVAWDGKSDKGAALPQGDYYVCLETAREHGPCSLVREQLTVGAGSFKKTLGTNNDLTLMLAYRAIG